MIPVMSQGKTVGSGGLDGTNRLPAPLASHDDVVKDSTLFWETLKSFHGVMGTKCMAPIIGGKDVDLHVLYVEVTRRGGYNQVVSEKKWREVSGVFEFSPTTTSASYALRKNYFSLLFRYEQVYFFRFEGLVVDPTTLGPGGDSCFEASGSIDGKFECGYLVSIKVGSEVLNGVLYHPDRPMPMSMPMPCSSSSSTTAIVPYAYVPDETRRKRRRMRKKNGGDPFRPKPNRSGYNFFFAEKHSLLKSLYPNREKREFTKMIGESWNNLTTQQRLVYQNYGLKDKERYQRELKEYKEKKMMISFPYTTT